jgi:hypothetical protein
MTFYVPVNGTWAADDGWVTSLNDPFSIFMASQHFHPVRLPEDTPWTWSGRLNGFLFSRWQQDWQEASESLGLMLGALPYEHRNLIAHSHGGAVAVLLAARGFPIRSLTTIGTPRRFDIHAEEAANHIGLWQHVYDSKRDWTATLRRLGGIGDGKVSTERRFLIPGVLNVGIGNISHSKMLLDPECFHLWIEHGLLDRIRL